MDLTLLAVANAVVGGIIWQWGYNRGRKYERERLRRNPFLLK